MITAVTPTCKHSPVLLWTLVATPPHSPPSPAWDQSPHFQGASPEVPPPEDRESHLSSQGHQQFLGAAQMTRGHTEYRKHLDPSVMGMQRRDPAVSCASNESLTSRVLSTPSYIFLDGSTTLYPGRLSHKHCWLLVRKCTQHPLPAV